LWGAGLVATSPVFLYQLMNAMGGVPVTAAWMLERRRLIGCPPAAWLAVAVIGIVWFNARVYESALPPVTARRPIATR
jgi:hypothetical protein